MDSLFIALDGRKIPVNVDADILQKLTNDDKLINYITDQVLSDKIEGVQAADLASLQIVCEVSTDPEANFQEDPLSLSPLEQQEVYHVEESTGQDQLAEAKEESKLTEHDYHSDYGLNAVWTRKGRTSSLDCNASALLLELRGSEKYRRLFEDRHTSKSRLWADIARELVRQGYEVDGERCRQKFQNMARTYFNYNKLVAHGVTGRSPPEFYNLLHDILASKEARIKKELDACNIITVPSINLGSCKVELPSSTTPTTQATLIDVKDQARIISLLPPHLRRKFTSTTNTATVSSPATSDGALRAIRPRPSSDDGNNLLPTSEVMNTASIIEAVRQEGRRTREQQDKHFEKLCSLIEEQNNQRRELIEVFRIIAGVKDKEQSKSKGCKRRHSSSSASEAS